MATVRFALVGVCYISEEHARLSGPPHHRDTLGKERFIKYVDSSKPIGSIEWIIVINEATGFKALYGRLFLK